MIDIYRFVSESLQTKAVKGAVIGASSGAYAAITQRQDTLIYKLEKKFKDTGDTRYQEFADKFKLMSPEDFRLYLVSRGIIVGGASGALAGVGVHALNDLSF